MLYGSFGQSIVEAFKHTWDVIVQNGPKWLIACLVVVVAYIIGRLIRKLVQRAVARTSTHGHVDLLIGRLVSGFVLGIGVLIALSVLQMNLSAALAALGLASVGLGFALQPILSNLFAGIILLLQHPFTIGDQVEVGGQEGVVESVNVRDTQILTYEGERVHIPNQTVFSEPIINYTSTPNLRMDVNISILYEEDITRAKRIAKEIVSSTRGVLQNPEPVILVEAETESVVLVIRFWMGSDRNRRLKVQSDILEWTIQAFKAEGIDIPYPVRILKSFQPPARGVKPRVDETQLIKPVPPADED